MSKLINSTSTGFKNTFSINKKISRSDYWWFLLGTILTEVFILIVAAFAMIPVLGNYLLGINNNFLVAIPLTIIAILFFFIMLVTLSQLTASVRRYVDLNMNRAMIFLIIIPYIGWIVTLIFMIMPSKKPDLQ